MASSTYAATLIALPFPSSSSSDDSDEHLPHPPVLEARRSSQKRQQWLKLERDCNVAMKELARAGDVDEVVELFSDLRRSASSAGISPNVLCYNTLLNTLAEAGRLKATEKAFDEMLAARVVPNSSSLNILVKLYSRGASDFGPVYKLIHVMRGHEVVPDVGTYSTLITGLCRAGRLTEALGVLDEMLEEGCLPMVQTYTPIVHGYCLEGRIDEARKLIDLMEGVGCPPNIVTYNVLIRALCDDARFKGAKQLLAKIITKGLKPSAVTYNTYMDGLCKKGMAVEALNWFHVMLGKGLDPTTFTWSIFLNCLCHASRVSDAIYLLEWSVAFDWCPGVVGYNTVMSRLCDMGRWPGVLKLLKDMIKKGVIPNTRTFNILIHSLCIGGKACIAKNLVFNQGFDANVVTYNTLIHWFYYHGKVSEVYDLIVDMEHVKKIEPDLVTYTIIIDGLCREGKFYDANEKFQESLKIGLSSDLLTVLINRLVHCDRTWNILEAIEGVRRHGYTCDYMIFDFIIRSFCRVGFCHYRKILELELVLDAMLGLGKEVSSAHKCQVTR